MDYFKRILEIRTRPPPREKTVWVENAPLCLLYAEFRPLDIIKYNLYNLCDVYGGSDASLTIVHGKDNREMIYELTANWKMVRRIEIPGDNIDIPRYSEIFRSFSFWDMFSAHDYVLTNQWDSYLFRRVPQKFFAYDFVGAPTVHSYVRTDKGFLNICGDGCACQRCIKYDNHLTESKYILKPGEKKFTMFNGGFSLRNVKAMKRISRMYNGSGNEPEDLFFCLKDEISKPEKNEGVEFSVQSYRYDGVPVGAHKIWEAGEEYVHKLLRTIDFGTIVGRFYLKQDLGLEDDDTPDLTTVSELIETYPMWPHWINSIPTKRKQLFTMFETSDVHPEIIENMKLFDRVVVPYDYLKDILTKHGINCVALNWYTSPLIRSRPRIFSKKRDPNNLIFLYVGTNDIRKNLKKLVDMFIDNIHTLIVKTNNLNNLPKVGNIKYITEHLTLDQMAQLYNACDYVISFTRGEGVGLPMLEAKYFRKPVICHTGGVLQTLYDDSWTVLPVHEVPVDTTDVPPFLKHVFHGTWWDVDEKASKKVIDSLYPIKIYYRLSDKGRRNGKPDYIQIENCLQNFCKHFNTDNITIVADNCESTTVDMISKYIDASKILTTSLGNSGAFLFAAKRAIEDNDDDTIVYLVEDDYMHTKGSEKIVREGFEWGDYVSLYDHPDKYKCMAGSNPLVVDGGENTKVFLSRSTHWKRTNSTTMTFAVKVKTLREDFGTMALHCRDNIPGDYELFCDLYKKNRTLVTPIPGRATHGQLPWLSPLVDWDKE